MADEAPPFTMDFRLAHLTLDCGTISLLDYNSAPGGHFGKVFFGWYRGMRVAVKILASEPGRRADIADAAFRKEAANLLAVRSTIDRARVRDGVGVTLFEPCNLRDPARRCVELHSLRGFKNAILVYGVGTEPDLADVAPGLPSGPAHLIVMEELTGGTLEDHSTHHRLTFMSSSESS